MTGRRPHRRRDAPAARQDVGDMGWAAYFKDVEGNLMGLWQSR